jgi:hypothetical protein
MEFFSLKLGLSSVRSFTTTVFWYSDPGLKYSSYIERVIYNACIKYIMLLFQLFIWNTALYQNAIHYTFTEFNIFFFSHCVY